MSNAYHTRTVKVPLEGEIVMQFSSDPQNPSQPLARIWAMQGI